MTPDTELDWRERIDQAKRILEARLHEDVALEDLADAVYASPFHFHRVFRGLTGETVGGYLRRLRLERAAHRLARGDSDILSLALDSGYDSHEAFTRAFKRQFGVTPSGFRSEHAIPAHPSGDLAMSPEIQVRIEHHPPKQIAFVRHVGPYDQVGDAWSTLMKWGWSKIMFGRVETFGLCFDDPDITPPDRLRYEACMTVNAKTQPKGVVQIRTLPESYCAVTLHEGPLSEISQTYSRLFAHVATKPIDGKHWRLGDPPSMERYLCDPRKTKPEDMRTEICMPVNLHSACQ